MILLIIDKLLVNMLIIHKTENWSYSTIPLRSFWKIGLFLNEQIFYNGISIVFDRWSSINNDIIEVKGHYIENMIPKYCLSTFGNILDQHVFPLFKVWTGIIWWQYYWSNGIQISTRVKNVKDSLP